MPDPQGAKVGRITALDGMRGLAALVVLVHHNVIATQSGAAIYRGESHPARWSLSWFLTNTPLHLFWAGDEAVFLFFVLSGFVLTRPVIKSQRFRWKPYYTRRLVRLYLPVWGSLVLAIVLTLAVARKTFPYFTWLNPSLTPGPSAKGLPLDFTLIFGTSGLNSPLWSLQWEVLFSLLLPLYVALTIFARRFGPFAFLAVAVIFGATLTVQSLTNLVIFGMGCLLAVHWSSIRRIADRISPAGWTALGLLSIVLITANWWLEVGKHVDGVRPAISNGLAICGATLMVVIFGVSRSGRRFGRTQTAEHLGRLSFSLYLVHWPVLVAVFTLLGPGTWQAHLVGSVLALIAAEIFSRLVEQPSHRLAQRCGRAVATRQTLKEAAKPRHRQESAATT